MKYTFAVLFLVVSPVVWGVDTGYTVNDGAWEDSNTWYEGNIPTKFAGVYNNVTRDSALSLVDLKIGYSGTLTVTHDIHCAELCRVGNINTSPVQVSTLVLKSGTLTTSDFDLALLDTSNPWERSGKLVLSGGTIRGYLSDLVNGEVVVEHLYPTAPIQIVGQVRIGWPYYSLGCTCEMFPTLPEGLEVGTEVPILQYGLLGQVSVRNMNRFDSWTSPTVEFAQDYGPETSPGTISARIIDTQPPTPGTLSLVEPKPAYNEVTVSYTDVADTHPEGKLASDVGDVVLEYSSDGGATWHPYATNTTGAASGSFTFAPSDHDSGPYAYDLRIAARDANDGYKGEAGHQGYNESDPLLRNVVHTTINFDKVSPTVTIGHTYGTSPIGSAVLSFTLEPSESLADGSFDSSRLTVGGIGSGWVATLSGNTATVAVPEGVEGAVTLGFNHEGVTDLAGNPLQSVTPATVQVDRIRPTLLSVSAPTLTNASTVNFALTFSEPVQGVSDDDFVLETTGVSGEITTVSGSDATYTVTVENITGNGTLAIGLDSDVSITDALGNALEGAMPSNLVTIDQTAPTCTFEEPSADRSGTGTITFTATFSEPVTGLSVGSLVVESTGVTFESKTLEGTTWILSGIGGSGGISAHLNPAGIHDAAGNALTSECSTPITPIDWGNPVVVAVSPEGESPTNASEVTFTVTFSEPVFWFDQNMVVIDFVPTGTQASVASVSPTPSKTKGEITYSVVIAGVKGDGELIITIPPSAEIKDEAGNPLAGGGSGSVRVDTVPPTLTISASTLSSTEKPGTCSDTLSFDITFNESVTITDPVDPAKNGQLVVSDFSFSIEDVNRENHGIFPESVTISPAAKSGVYHITASFDSQSSDNGYLAGNVSVLVGGYSVITDAVGNRFLDSTQSLGYILSTFGDVDGDGSSNGQEVALVSDPYNANQNVPLAWWPVAIALVLAALVVLRRDKKAALGR